jgi:hypothetical protein
LSQEYILKNPDPSLSQFKNCPSNCLIGRLKYDKISITIHVVYNIPHFMGGKEEPDLLENV